MSTSPVSNQHPAFGYNPTTPITGTLTQAALTGTAFQRQASLYEATVYVSCTAYAGGGSASVVLEGSNDGVNWFTLSSLPASQYFTGTGTRTLGGGNDEVSLERWNYLRVRSLVTAGNPTFTMAYTFAGISGDSEKFLWSGTMAWAGTAVSGSSTIRPSGTRYAQVQLTATGVVLGAASSYGVELQGSVDGGTTWVNIATYLITANAQVAMTSNEGNALIDLGPYSRFRMYVHEIGGAGTSATIAWYLTLDSQDWLFLSLPPGGSVLPTLSDALLQVVSGPAGAEALDTIVVPVQVYDASGNPVTRAVLLQAIVYDTSNAGVTDLSTNATITAVGSGTLVSGGTTNRVSFLTSASGYATVSVLDAVAETVFFAVTQLEGPLSTYQIVWNSNQVSLTFAP